MFENSVSGQRGCAICFENKPSNAFAPCQVKGNPEHHKVHECWIDAQCLLEYINAKSRLDTSAVCPFCAKEITSVGGIPLLLIRAALSSPTPTYGFVRTAIIARARATPDHVRIDFARSSVRALRIGSTRIGALVDTRGDFGIDRARIAVESACAALERVIAAPALDHATLDPALADLAYAFNALDRAFNRAPPDAGHVYASLLQKAYGALGVIAIYNSGFAPFIFADSVVRRTSAAAAGVFSNYPSLYFLGMGIVVCALLSLARKFKE